MAELNNFKITSCTMKREGSKAGRSWTLYNFTIDAPEWGNETFSYFQSGKKPTPEANMEIKAMEFNGEVNEYDEYTANVITPVERASGSRRITPAGPTPKGKATPVPAPPKVDTKLLSILTSYHKDISVAKMGRLTAEEALGMDTDTLLNDAVSGAMTAYGAIESFKETFFEMRKGNHEQEDPPSEEDDDVPFG